MPYSKAVGLLVTLAVLMHLHLLVCVALAAACVVNDLTPSDTRRQARARDQQLARHTRDRDSQGQLHNITDRRDYFRTAGEVRQRGAVNPASRERSRGERAPPRTRVRWTRPITAVLERSERRPTRRRRTHRPLLRGRAAFSSACRSSSRPPARSGVPVARGWCLIISNSCRCVSNSRPRCRILALQSLARGIASVELLWGWDGMRAVPRGVVVR